jgi:hypothetical protein
MYIQAMAHTRITMEQHHQQQQNTNSTAMLTKAANNNGHHGSGAANGYTREEVCCEYIFIAIHFLRCPMKVQKI